jgi:lipoprotein-anchoring transpeptidase ErfK/SrfK
VGPVRRRPARSPRRQLNGFLLAFSVIALCLALVIILSAGFLLFYSYGADEPAQPTALVASAPTARATTPYAQQVAALRREWPWRTVVLDAGFKTWVVTPEELGLRLDVEATAAQPASAGQAQSTSGLLTTSAGDAFFPVWSFDRAVAKGTLGTIASEIEIKAQNAGVRIVGARLEATPAQAGRALDIVSTLKGMERDPWAVVSSGRLPLVLATAQPTIGDAGPALAKAGAWLSAPTTLHLYDPYKDEKLTWTVQPEAVVDWLTIGPATEAPTTLDCIMDQAKVEAYLEGQSAALGEGRYLDAGEAAPALIDAVVGAGRVANLRVYHREKRHSVAAGETFSSLGLLYGIPYPWIQRANPAAGEALRVGQVVTIPSTDLLMPLSPVENKRIVVSVAQQRMMAYENGALKWNWPASTGLDSSPTALGVFQIQSHEMTAYASNWNLWMPYFMGVYQPAPDQDFMNGFHGFPTRDNRQILWQGNLGQPVTYGCILISTENAELLYDWAEEGVIVEIRRQ